MFKRSIKVVAAHLYRCKNCGELFDFSKVDKCPNCGLK